MRFFICGSALRGQPDHANLLDATFLQTTSTAPRYRLHSVGGEHPGIYRVDDGGIAIAGEVYDFTAEQHSHLLAHEPPDLYESDIELSDGTTAKAMLYPRALIEERGYEDVSEFGGWSEFKKSRSAS